MIQVHNSLNPELWQDKVLIPEIRKQLIKISAAFYDTLKIKVVPEDILLTGSSANYNYTPNSDIDLHILLNFKKINCELDFTKEYFLNKKSLWNNEHEITIKGKDVELYVQDIREPHKSTGIYSVMQDKWLVKPSMSNFYLQNVNKNEILQKYNHIKELIDYNLKNNTNYKFLKKIKEKISKMRKDGLKEGGETDIKNLVFKELRNNKYIDKITDAITQDIDRQLSIETFASFMS